MLQLILDRHAEDVQGEPCAGAEESLKAEAVRCEGDEVEWGKNLAIVMES